MSEATKKKFDGIELYTKEEFNNVTPQNGVLYLVRQNKNNNNPGVVEIWFGNRLYAISNNDIKCGEF